MVEVWWGRTKMFLNKWNLSVSVVIVSLLVIHFLHYLSWIENKEQHFIIRSLPYWQLLFEFVKGFESASWLWHKMLGWIALCINDVTFARNTRLSDKQHHIRNYRIIHGPNCTSANPSNTITNSIVCTVSKPGHVNARMCYKILACLSEIRALGFYF